MRICLTNNLIESGGRQMDLNNMLIEIAEYRSRMNRFSKGKILTHPDVIKLSRGLDVLIYKYLKALRQQNAALKMSKRDSSRAEAF